MTSLAVTVPYLIMGLLGVTFFWGSLMAFRGRKWWATLLLLIGSGLQVVAAVTLAVAMVIMINGFASSGGAGGPGPGPVPTLMPFLLGAGMILYALGFILFGAGFVGFCGRSGATERRSAELEGMLTDLQERVNHPS